MVKVYFETPNNSYAELVAIFESEDTYMLCLPILESEAKKDGMIVTESVVEDSLNDSEEKAPSYVRSHGGGPYIRVNKNKS